MNQLRPPAIEWTRACPICAGPLYRTITGNTIDYRHPGGATQCPEHQ